MSGPGPTLFLSRAGDRPVQTMLGEAHYSYQVAADKFHSMLTRFGHPPRLLRMPEYYATRSAMADAPPGPWIHLAFRSTREMRLLHPAINIAVFAWEFPVLKTETLPGEHPFANQRAMLAMFDEIWVPCEFTRATLAAHGLARVRCIPAPIPVPAQPDRAAGRRLLAETDAVPLRINPAWPARLQTDTLEALRAPADRLIAAAARRPVRFLAVLNPEDRRKNLDALLHGFHMHRKEFPDSVLLLKLLVAPGRMTLADAAGNAISRQLHGAIADPGIVLFNRFLTDPQMTALYALADFYLCAPIAEGQNLPLLEAMGAGAVAISPATTAMRDFITPETAVVMPTRSRLNDDPALAGMVAGRNFAIDRASPRDIATILAAARRLPRAEQARRAAAGRQIVADRYAEQAVWPLVAARLADLAGAA